MKWNIDNRCYSIDDITETTETKKSNLFKLWSNKYEFFFLKKYNRVEKKVIRFKNSVQMENFVTYDEN